jgi:HAD superfamily hydrolase (TIGR01509 family)
VTNLAETSRGLPRAVLFDFDGTLADSEPLITASLIHALGTEGFHVTAEQVRGVFGPPLLEMVRLLAGTLPEEQQARLRTAYFDDYNTYQLPNIKPLPGAIELLDALAARQIPLGMVTNKFEASAAAQLAALGWQDRFPVVIGAESVALPKPAPDAALAALARLNVSAEEAAFVGDQEPDMECAVAAGIPVVIGLAHARAAETLAASGATYVAGSLAEVEAILLRGDSVCA